MKAILVIDMPDTLENHLDKVKVDVIGTLNGQELFHRLNQPLKHLPEKLLEISYDSWWGWNKILDRVIEEQIKVVDFAKGWNACLEELEK